MNYFIMTTNSLKRNIRKQITFIITCIIAVTLHFLYTTLMYNSGTVLISKASILGIILSASIAIIIILLSFFTIYSYTSYIRLRSKEFKIMMLIGMTKRELTLCILFENLILMVVCLSIGILLGTIFSKFFFLVIINYLGFPSLVFSLGTANYISNLQFFIILYVIITLRTIKLLKMADSVNVSIVGKQKKKARERINLIIGIFCIIAYIYAMIHEAKIGKSIYFYIWISCMLMIYIMVFYGSKIIIKIINKKNYFYRGNFLLTKQLAKNLEKDSVFIFLLTYVSFMFITYNFICEVSVFTKYSKEITSNGIKIFRIITVLMNLLFFAISSSITYFKFQMELENTNRYFKKLYMIGITKEEFDLVIKCRLISIFFIPCTLCAITSIIFLLAVGIHINRFNFNEGVIVISYFFNIYGYNNAKRLYVESNILR